MSSHKYETGADWVNPLDEASRWARAASVTDHAAARWRHRMPDGAVSIRDALARSVPVPEEAKPLFPTGEHRAPDAVRLFRGRVDGTVYGAVFLVQLDPTYPVVVTTYRIELRYDPAVRAYCWARLSDVAIAGDDL